MKYLSLIILALFLTASKYVDVIIKDEAPAKLVWVIDGDTFKARTNIYGEEIQTKIRIRGIDTPEIEGECEYEKDLAQKAKHFTINFLKDKEIILKNISKGYYKGRYVADVFANGKNLGDALLKAKLAEIYINHQYDWCN